MRWPWKYQKRREIASPVDEFVHTWDRGDQIITFTWLGDADVRPSRVYALAFVSGEQMLLVSGGAADPRRWLPGGGVEDGETPRQALHRELLEEAGATVLAAERIGAQRVDEQRCPPQYNAFYWCRVTLADHFVPGAETTARHLVSPADFLDTLFWGRLDPKAPLLLQRALALERAY